MAALIRWPFPLPERFLDQLGYRRVVEAFDSPVMRAQLTELLRQQGLDATQATPAGPRRYVALWWSPAGDELAWSDGKRSGEGQLDPWVWLDYLRGPRQIGGPIYGWLVEHQVDLGSSDSPATHALIVDRQTLEAHVAPLALAHRIVRAQALDQEAQP